MALGALHVRSGQLMSCSRAPKLSVDSVYAAPCSHQTTTWGVAESSRIDAAQAAASTRTQSKWVGNSVSRKSCLVAALPSTKSAAKGATFWSGRFRCEDVPHAPGSRGRRFVRVMPEDAQNSSEATDSRVEKKREYFLPTTLDESIDQARTATRQAIRDGVKRIQLEVLLPLIGATDLDDWPGGIQQQYKAAGPVITSLLKGLADDESYKEDGRCRKYIIDNSDAVGVWESDKIALVLFPTAETLSKVEALAKNEDRPLLIVNTQWRSGQVISDFGFGSQKRAREEFVNSFEVVYLLKSMRILGEDMQLLKRYPGDWQVFVLDAAGVANKSVAVVPQRPSYKELEVILKSRKGSKAGQHWFTRLFLELEFNQKSLNDNSNL